MGAALSSSATTTGPALSVRRGERLRSEGIQALVWFVTAVLVVVPLLPLIYASVRSRPLYAPGGSRGSDLPRQAQHPADERRNAPALRPRDRRTGRGARRPPARHHRRRPRARRTVLQTHDPRRSKPCLTC